MKYYISNNSGSLFIAYMGNKSFYWTKDNNSAYAFPSVDEVDLVLSSLTVDRDVDIFTVLTENEFLIKSIIE